MNEKKQIEFWELVKKYNKCENINSSSYVYKEQMTAAAIVLNSLVEYPVTYLVAEMQSGKTGVLTSIYNVLHNASDNELESLGLLLSRNNSKGTCIKDGMMIISAPSSLYLKEQTSERLDGFPVLNGGSGQLKNKINKIKITDNTLIAIDEVHYGALKEQLIDDFYNSSGLRLNEIESLKEKNIKSFYISATPFALLLKEEENSKLVKRVVLESGENYYGIKKMFENDKIRSAYRLQSESPAFIADIKQDGFLLEKKYIIIRYKTNQAALIENIQKAFGTDVSIIKIDSESKDNLDIFDIEPEKPTFALIKEYLRLGYSLNTKFIFAVHDTPQGQVDTISQSLLGRCCGYGKAADQVIIYTDVDAAEAYRDFIESGFDYKLVPYGSGVSKNTSYVSPESQYPIKILISKEIYNCLMDDQKNRWENIQKIITKSLDDDSFIIKANSDADSITQNILNKKYRQFVTEEIREYLSAESFSRALNNVNIDSKKQTAKKYLNDIRRNFEESMTTSRNCYRKNNIKGTVWIDHTVNCEALFLTWLSGKISFKSNEPKTYLNSKSNLSKEQVIKRRTKNIVGKYNPLPRFNLK